MTTAFVLSGGACLGAAQAGMLEALYEREVHPDLLIGTSVGAMNAAFAASRPASVATAIELQRLWRSMNRSRVFPVNPISVGLSFVGTLDHSVPVGALRRLVDSHLGFGRLEDAPVALHVLAADVLNGEEVRLSSGNALDAVLASAAIPGVFPPVRWGDRLLMDGGVANNAPVTHAVELGADRIVVLPASGPTRLTEPPRGAVVSAVVAITRAITRRLEEDVAWAADHAEVIVLPGPALEGVLPTDFARADELIEEALRRSRTVLARHAPRRHLRAA
jgi:NTE family protein